ARVPGRPEQLRMGVADVEAGQDALAEVTQERPLGEGVVHHSQQGRASGGLLSGPGIGPGHGDAHSTQAPSTFSEREPLPCPGTRQTGTGPPRPAGGVYSFGTSGIPGSPVIVTGPRKRLARKGCERYGQADC